VIIALTQDAAARLAAIQTGLHLSLAERLTGVVGIAAMIGIALVISYDRRRIDWRTVGSGLALQLLIGVLVLKTGAGRTLFDALGDGFNQVIGFARDGARLIFGDLVDKPAFLAFSVLPAVIFFSSLMSVLYYLGVMQVVVRAIAWVMRKTLRTSGAESLSASGNIFLGQIEAPLLVKPFVAGFTPSELFTVMVGGFATIGGGIMAAYVAMLSGLFPNIAGHLMAASVMNAPAGLYLAKIIRPETGTPVTRDAPRIGLARTESGVIEAAAGGALQGVQLVINIAAVLIAFVGLVALLNALLGWMGGWWGQPALSLPWILGQLLRPVAWILGVTWRDTAYVGGLIGLKTALNEFVAYAQFAKDLAAGVTVAPRSAIILTYALLGFANFGSIAIQIGGIGSLAPERRGEISRYGLRAMIAGNLAAFTSAALAGMLM
jgi:CNT family concentrative nucleoside transporter